MMGVSAQQTRINVAIAAWPWPSYFSPEARMKGIRLQISKWRRPSLKLNQYMQKQPDFI